VRAYDRLARARRRHKALAILERSQSRDPEPEAMPSISIAKKHALSHRKAKEVAERIAKDLKKRFELEYAWEGDHVDFERPGISGRMHVGKTDISLDVNLGLLLTPLKPAIEREIHAQLDKLIVSRKA
jgi:putative polyhydroxyalkanoate system protein